MSEDKIILSKNEWLILSSLSDDRECLSSIDEPELSRTEMVELLEGLYKRGLICIESGTLFERKKLLEEPDKHWDTAYWFGLTEKGCKEWEAHSQQYSGQPVDWSSSWKGEFFDDKREGYIEGVSEKVCMQALENHLKDIPFTIDSIKHKEIDGFQAKYYKYIAGGHRIDFKLKRKL